MKNLLYLFLFSLSLFTFSCSDDDDEKEFIGDNYTVHTFRLKGEIWDEDGMDPNESALYGIEVLSTDGTPYAYGLFDNLSKAKVKLLKEQQFVFRVTVVPDGKHVCRTCASNEYGDIFLLTSDDKVGTACKLLNKFAYNREVHFLHFSNPQKSFYYRIFMGCQCGGTVGNGEAILVDTKSIYTIISVSVHGSFGRAEFRLMSDVGEVAECPYDELSTPVFTLTPENREVEFYYSLRNWGKNKEYITDDFELQVGRAYRIFDTNGNMKEEFVDTDLSISRGYLQLRDIPLL